jgi:hypothetical protein
MPKIKSELAESQEPVEGQTYKIVAVEEIKTSVQGFSGYRVVLEPEKRKEGDQTKYATMLWARDVAGRFSKLGSFIAAFKQVLTDEDAMNTDNWVGHIIRIVSWQPRKREIRVVS